MKKSLREIQEGLEEKMTSDTNTLIDISSADRDMRKLVSALNRQLKELRERRHRFCQGDFELKDAVAGVSHDLRTPLTAICGYLALLEREETNETVRQYLNQIADRAETMKMLMEDFLHYSVMTSVREMEPEPLCLNHVLEECMASFYGVITQHGITPQIAIPDARVERILDKSFLTRVFENIISNAIKYGSGDLSVEMDEDGVIVFSNTAENLSAVAVGRLFDRLYTVEMMEKSTGLGLSIAKLLTKQMGGSITADYKNDKLMITICFPPEGTVAAESV